MPRRNAFTLVELVVVITIIGFLVALLLPAVQAAREAARRSSCSNNLSQIITATQNYEMTYGCYPLGTVEKKGPIVNLPRGYHHGWVTRILPYAEQTNTFAHVDFKVGVYHKNNAPARVHSLKLLRCPSSPGGGKGVVSNYAGVHHDSEAPIDVDNNGVFVLNRRIMYEDVSDGSSNTIFFGEKHIDANDLGWMSGTRATLRNTGSPFVRWATVRTAGTFLRLPGLPDDFFPDGPGMPGSPPQTRIEPLEGDAAPESPNPADLVVGGFGSVHPGGVQFAMGDGSARFLSQTINPQVLQQLACRHDGEMLGDF